LPIPSSIPNGASPDDVAQNRARISPAGTPVVGHLGTYGDHVAAELFALLPAIAAQAPIARFAFMGSGSREFLERLRDRHPQIASRAWASGRLAASDLSAVLGSCDLLIQPYPDGITTRRTSAMAGLRNGVATVSTSGTLTESIWKDTGAVALAPVSDRGLGSSWKRETPARGVTSRFSSPTAPRRCRRTSRSRLVRHSPGHAA